LGIAFIVVEIMKGYKVGRGKLGRSEVRGQIAEVKTNTPTAWDFTSAI